jgi:hypothetical protein
MLRFLTRKGRAVETLTSIEVLDPRAFPAIWAGLEANRPFYLQAINEKRFFLIVRPLRVCFGDSGRLYIPRRMSRARIADVHQDMEADDDGDDHVAALAAGGGRGRAWCAQHLDPVPGGTALSLRA